MGDAALNFDMEASELTAVPRNGRRWVECMVCAVGLLTACMSAASAIYKPPAGIFVGHKRAYYTSVVAAGVVGLVEACLAVVWLSDGRWQQEQQQQQQEEEGRHQQQEGQHQQQQEQQGRQQHERRRQQQQRRFARRCILCASLLPLAFMAGIGGVRILVK